MASRERPRRSSWYDATRRPAVAGHHLDLAAPQARGDLEVGRSPRCPPRPCGAWPRGQTPAGRTCAPYSAVLEPAGVRRRTGGCHSRAATWLELARRARGARRRRSPGTTTPAPYRRDPGPTRPRDQRLLAVRGLDGVEVPVAEARHQPLEDRPRSAPRAPRRAPAAGPAKRATTSTVMSSAVGPESAARDDQVDPCVGQEAELRVDVLRPVAADRDVREFHAQLEQPVGQPGAVAVADPPGEDLRAGHDDARASAHALRARDALRSAAARACS